MFKKFERIKKLFGRMREKEEQKEEQAPSPLDVAASFAEERARLNLYEEMRQKYAALLQTTALRENQVLYEAFGGRGMTCSPYAFFCCLLEEEAYKDLVHVWVIDDLEDNAWKIRRYEKYENVRFVKYQSLEYREALATSKYLINNVSFPGFFTKREGQIYLNTWHGIPLKTIGFDIPTGNVSAGNSARNLLAADYLMSPNSFMTEIYEKAFKLKGLYQGTILEEGQPRNDRYFHADRRKVFEDLAACGVQADPDKKLILYAPTWKGSRYSSPDTSLDTYYQVIRQIEKRVDTRKYQILVKPHQIVYYHIKKNLGMTDRFIPATVDTNELLSAVDVLISDYSSIYFDFLVSGRPILFFIPDLDEYLDYRGLYFGIDKLPGPIATSCQELGRMVENLDAAMEPCREKYEREAKWACEKDDGQVCRRVMEVVLGGRKTEAKEEPAPKKRLLLYAGNLSRNMDVLSLEALSRLLDYDRYDVTLLVEAARDEKEEERIRSLPSSFRVLYRGQPENGTPRELGALSLFLEGEQEGGDLPLDFCRRELRRLFGESRFDAAVDLVGGRTLFSCLGKAMEGCKSLSFTEPFLDLEAVEQAKKKEELLILEGTSYYLDETKGEDTSRLEISAIPLPQHTDHLFAAMGTMGEADLGALLEQFVFVYEKNKKSVLYLVGDCPEKEKLQYQARENGLSEAIFFTGPLQRPWAFLAHCACLVIPEGQEDTVMGLYARAMGTGVCKMDFTPFTDPSFDGEEYNRRQYERFERCCQ
ncbi:MAG: CDP-glycerol glycerophosphotransferase family protein [Eubacteriales bacterium]|nr:CDP-glycerol glycerophosphotransferase family protein [Eubacteriales bacterium]